MSRLQSSPVIGADELSDIKKTACSIRRVKLMMHRPNEMLEDKGRVNPQNYDCNSTL
jgi:hypothetical protein